jgi:hypothetical protein
MVSGAKHRPQSVHVSTGVPPSASGRAAKRAQLVIGLVTADE